jgi:tripartite-type tricarboxylate transporter receptor subunit TctC
MERRHVVTLGVAALIAPLVSPTAAVAQPKYPDRPIRLVIPYPPGGVYDATGRPWAEKVKSLLGTIVIENQGGAGSSLGTAAVARAQPDGYTILLAGNSGLVINPLAAARSPYDPVKDFEPIAILGLNPTAIEVHPSLPIRDLKELIDYAKANKGQLSYGSSGVGTVNHLIGELLKSLTGTDITHVPYRGAGPAMADLISGHIPMLLQSVTGQSIEMHLAGKLRMLAVTGPSRVSAAPDIPTVGEAGMPDLTSQQFIGLFAPKGTPKAIVEQISAATRTAMADRELQQMYAASGFEPALDSNPDQAGRLVREEIARWAPIIKSIGLKLE